MKHLHKMTQLRTGLLPIAMNKDLSSYFMEKKKDVGKYLFSSSAKQIGGCLELSGHQANTNSMRDATISKY